MNFHDITIANKTEELNRVHDLVTAFSAAHALSPEIVFDLNVVLDELLSNIIKYGYADSAGHEIQIRLSADQREVTVEIRDDGLPFNPMEQAAPDLNRSLAERRIGGMGLHFVRQLMDHISYKRLEKHNHLVLRKLTHR